MEVVESSDESDSDSDEKGDVNAIFCRILQNTICHFLGFGRNDCMLLTHCP